MPFDAKKYTKEERRARTGAVEVPALSDYFDEGEEALWQTRGISGYEYLELKNSIGDPETISAAITAIAGFGDQVEAVKQMLGIMPDLTENDRLNMLLFVAGSVDESINFELAKRILNDHFTTYCRIVSSIDQLTGIGFVPGKPGRSGSAKT